MELYHNHVQQTLNSDDFMDDDEKKPEGSNQKINGSLSGQALVMPESSQA